MPPSVADLLRKALLPALGGRTKEHMYACNEAGTTYHLSPSGADDDIGTSPARAWRSLARVNRHRFGPGDRLLLQAGHEFAGSLCLGADSVGTPRRPISIGSYGSGRATIRAASGPGVLIKNVGGIWISGINVVGDGRGATTGAGIDISNNLPHSVKLAFIRIDQVEVSGFAGDGIALGGRREKSGFKDVLIEHVTVHHNGRNGLNVYGEWNPISRAYANENVILRYVTAYANSGIRGEDLAHTGSGIILSDVNHGLVERCLAFDNGWLSNSIEGGPVGIWAHDSNDIVIQHNESYGNRTAGRCDGGGFDLDGGVTNSVLQYNYAHDNDGPGYLLAQYETARPFGRNLVRFNISQNDARKNAYGAIHGFGDLRETDIHNNTIFVDCVEAARPVVINFGRGLQSQIRVLNNIFYTGIGVTIVRVEASRGVTFLGNNYYTSGENPLVDWASVTYRDLASWRSMTGQERLGDKDVGSSVDPRLRAAGRGERLGDARLLETLDAYQLTEATPLAGAGVDLRAIGADPGPRDFRGTTLLPTHSCDVGAFASSVDEVAEGRPSFIISCAPRCR